MVTPSRKSVGPSIGVGDIIVRLGKGKLSKFKLVKSCFSEFICFEVKPFNAFSIKRNWGNFRYFQKLIAL